MTGFQFLVIVCVFCVAFLAYVFWATRDKLKPEKPAKYIISKNGYGEYFVREVWDEDHSYTYRIFIHKKLMNMAQVDNAIKAYEDHQIKSKKEEVKRIY